MSELELKYLSEEELREFVRKAMESGKEESKFILVLETWYRQGPSFVSERTFEAVYGEIEEVKLEEDCEPYPHRCFSRYAIIPKTVPSIILVEERDNTIDPPIYERIVYVFTSQGWKRIKVQ